MYPVPCVGSSAAAKSSRAGMATAGTSAAATMAFAAAAAAAGPTAAQGVEMAAQAAANAAASSMEQGFKEDENCQPNKNPYLLSWCKKTAAELPSRQSGRGTGWKSNTKRTMSVQAASDPQFDDCKEDAQYDKECLNSVGPHNWDTFIKSMPDPTLSTSKSWNSTIQSRLHQYQQQYSTLQCIAVHDIAVRYNAVRGIAIHCSTVQCSAVQ